MSRPDPQGSVFQGSRRDRSQSSEGNFSPVLPTMDASSGHRVPTLQ